MAIEIKAPAFPESVADGEVAAWHKQEGESVHADELIVEIETDKVVMEVVAPEDGVITKIHAQEGDTIESEQLLATLEQGAVGEHCGTQPRSLGAAASVRGDLRRKWGRPRGSWWKSTSWMSAQISGTGKDGRITKEDILKYMKSARATPAASPAARSYC